MPVEYPPHKLQAVSLFLQAPQQLLRRALGQSWSRPRWLERAAKNAEFRVATGMIVPNADVN